VADLLDYCAPRYPHSPGFRDQDTSLKAAEATLPRAQLLRDRVLVQLRRGNFTADECAARMGESILSVRPRFTELKKLGLIRDTGDRRSNESGQTAKVWAIKETH
jgi:hypothetical protein